VLGSLPATETTCAGLGAAPNTFFATAQSGPGGGMCDATGTDDVFGCGTYGIPPADTSCDPLDRVSGNECRDIKLIGGWVCTYPDEVRNIKKSEPLLGGGVLCCRDPL
jgi:hypothetical protein